MRYRKLSDDQESELLVKTIQRKMLGEKELCKQYNVSRATLRVAIKRARARREATCTAS